MPAARRGPGASRRSPDPALRRGHEMTGCQDGRRGRTAEVTGRAEYPKTEATTKMENTNTATETTITVPAKKARKADRPKYNYPFATKAQILDAQQDFTVCLEHLGQLYDAQTSDEQEAKDTRYKNKSGFMSSHAVTGSSLAVKARSGEALTGEEQDKVRSIVCRYGKQLARFSREAAIKANPDLKKVAEIFSAD